MKIYFETLSITVDGVNYNKRFQHGYEFVFTRRDKKYKLSAVYDEDTVSLFYTLKRF
jgi:hypothetical protein